MASLKCTCAACAKHCGDYSNEHDLPKALVEVIAEVTGAFIGPPKTLGASKWYGVYFELGPSGPGEIELACMRTQFKDLYRAVLTNPLYDTMAMLLASAVGLTTVAQTVVRDWMESLIVTKEPASKPDQVAVTSVEKSVRSKGVPTMKRAFAVIQTDEDCRYIWFAGDKSVGEQFGIVYGATIGEKYVIVDARYDFEEVVDYLKSLK